MRVRWVEDTNQGVRRGQGLDSWENVFIYGGSRERCPGDWNGRIRRMTSCKSTGKEFWEGSRGASAECQGTWISMDSDQGLRWRSWTGQIQVHRGCGLDIWSAVCLCVGEWGFHGMWVLRFRVEITLESPRVHCRWGEDVFCASVQWLSLGGVGGPEGWVGQGTERVGGKGMEDWKHRQ